MSRTQQLLFQISIVLCLEGLSLAFTNGDLRLSGIGSNRLAGRLEIFHDNQWGTVCGGGPQDGNGFNFGPRAAQIACRQMGLSFAVDYFSASHLPEQRYQFGHGEGDIFLTEVNCQEEHTHILQCTYGLIGVDPDSGCDHSMDVSVQCSEITSPYNGGIRLTHSSLSPSPSSGIVELYTNSQWKGVCLDGVTIPTADTLCRQLGYTEMDRLETIPGSQCTNVWDLTLPSSCGANSMCISSCLNNQLPTSARSPCQTVLLHCRFNADCAELECDDFLNIRSTCSLPPTPTPEKSIRLESNVSPSVRTRVDVFVDGAWGTFCSLGFSLMEADVVCKQAGFSAALGYSDVTMPSNSDVSRGTGSVHSLNCTGLERHIAACTVSLVVSEQCNTHDHDVTVHCSDLIAPYGSVALRGPSDRVGGSSGTLVVFTGDEFRPVCDAGFGSQEAQVVCLQLGYSSRGRAIPNSFFGIGTSSNTNPRMVRLTGSCSGPESSILACGPGGYTDVVGSECTAGFDEVAVECFPEEAEIDFLLVSESGEEEEAGTGRLRMLFNGSAGRVCGEEFGWNEAVVMCKYLGFQSLLRIERRDQLSRTPPLPVHLRELSCHGVEENPLHCNFSLNGRTACPPGDLDIWLECGTAPLESDGDLRLVGGVTTPTGLSGRLEISQNKKWLSVCGGFFTEEAAQVACRQLGYRVAANYCTNACFGEGDNDVFFAEHRCLGEESSLLDCRTERYHPRVCNLSTMVGLFCEDRIILPSTPEFLPTPMTLGSSTPKPGMPMFVYYIIGGVGGAVMLLVVIIATVCCVCCCHRRWREKHRGTWTSAHNQRNRSNQNGHSYHNGVVGDMNALAKEKEGGFDDPKDALESNGSPPSPFPHTVSAHHDVILHALNHSHEEQGRYIAPKTKVKEQTTRTNGYHVHHVGNGIGGTMPNGVGMGHRNSDNPSPMSDLPTCLPPDYNELFRSESATPIRQANGIRRPNGCYANSRDRCEGSDGDDAEKGKV